LFLLALVKIKYSGFSSSYPMAVLPLLF